MSLYIKVFSLVNTQSKNTFIDSTGNVILELNVFKISQAPFDCMSPPHLVVDMSYLSTATTGLWIAVGRRCATLSTTTTATSTRTPTSSPSWTSGPPSTPWTPSGTG